MSFYLSCLAVWVPWHSWFYKRMSFISFRKALVISSSNIATTPFINVCYIFYMYPVYILTSVLYFSSFAYIYIFFWVDSSAITCSLFISNLSNIKQTNKQKNPKSFHWDLNFSFCIYPLFQFSVFFNLQCYCLRFAVFVRRFKFDFYLHNLSKHSCLVSCVPDNFSTWHISVFISIVCYSCCISFMVHHPSHIWISLIICLLLHMKIIVRNEVWNDFYLPLKQSLKCFGQMFKAWMHS